LDYSDIVDSAIQSNRVILETEISEQLYYYPEEFNQDTEMLGGYDTSETDRYEELQSYGHAPQTPRSFGCFFETQIIIRGNFSIVCFLFLF
jgi:hypothetical protein